MRKSIGRCGGSAIVVGALAVGACTQPTDPPLPAARPATAEGSIEVIDLMAGKRRVTPDWAAINAQPLGSRGNPVRVEMPPGQHAYLRRLTCVDGSTPTFARAGNYGPGPFTTIIDGYEVRCPGSTTMIFMDMYHAGYVERRAVPGFGIRPAL